MQTDAAVNHGDSGGALLNLAGELVGLMTTVVRETPTGLAVEGIAFAQSSNSLRPIIEDIITLGVHPRPRLGIERPFRQHIELTPELAAAQGFPLELGALVTRDRARQRGGGGGAAAGRRRGRSQLRPGRPPPSVREPAEGPRPRRPRRAGGDSRRPATRDPSSAKAGVTHARIRAPTDPPRPRPLRTARRRARGVRVRLRGRAKRSRAAARRRRDRRARPGDRDPDPAADLSARRGSGDTGAGITTSARDELPPLPAGLVARSELYDITVDDEIAGPATLTVRLGDRAADGST